MQPGVPSASRWLHWKSSREEDIAPAFDAVKDNGADALYVVLDPIMSAHRVRINILAVGARLPTIFRSFGHLSKRVV